jgi:hypothetical protein
LAERIGMVTPEQKIQQILEQLNQNFNQTLSVSQINKNSSIQFGKSLKFKYRPKIRYSYEFLSNQEGKYAVLKISCRTKSEILNEHFESFFSLISDIENERRLDDDKWVENTTNHKFVRAFQEEGGLSKDVESVAGNLTAYLKMIDEAMNVYFSEIDEGKDLSEQMNAIYQKFIKKQR